MAWAWDGGIFNTSVTTVHARDPTGNRSQASLTGKMWQNMQVQFKAGRKGTGSVRFEVKFMKGQRVGYHPTKKTKTGRRQSVSVRNRVKAKMLQYNKRDGRGRPVGQAFVLMQPSDAEIGLMLQLISAGIRFANK